MRGPLAARAMRRGAAGESHHTTGAPHLPQVKAQTCLQSHVPLKQSTKGLLICTAVKCAH